MPLAEKLGAAALAILALAGAGALALRAMVRVVGVMQGGVELAAEADGDGGAGGTAGPNVQMSWDLQVEPAASDDSEPRPLPKPTEETAP
jgi:hypothetical protein